MLIVWDYFGVLAQDAFWYTAARIAEGKSMSEHMHDMQQKADLGEITWDEYCAEISNDIGVPYNEVVERYKHHDIKQDVVTAIHALHGSHKQVLLSNASHGYLLPIMHDLGLDMLFDEIFVSSKVGFAKPDPRAFNNVLQLMKTEAKDAIMIDDSARNISAATSLGMRTIHYGPDVDLAKELKLIIDLYVQ